jgi:hypothetical protein
MVGIFIVPIFLAFLKTLKNNILVHYLFEFLEFLEVKEEFNKKGWSHLRIHEVSNDLVGLQELKNANFKSSKPETEEEQMVYIYIEKLN